jgi:hypothetical protein
MVLSPCWSTESCWRLSPLDNGGFSLFVWAYVCCNLVLFKMKEVACWVHNVHLCWQGRKSGWKHIVEDVMWTLEKELVSNLYTFCRSLHTNLTSAPLHLHTLFVWVSRTTSKAWRKVLIWQSLSLDKFCGCEMWCLSLQIGQWGHLASSSRIPVLCIVRANLGFWLWQQSTRSD